MNQGYETEKNPEGIKRYFLEKHFVNKPNQISSTLKNEIAVKWWINRWYASLEYLQDLPGFLSPRTKSSSDHCQVKNLFPKMPTLLQWWQSEINKIKFKKLISLWIKFGHTTRVGLFYRGNPHFHYTIYGQCQDKNWITSGWNWVGVITV